MPTARTWRVTLFALTLSMALPVLAQPAPAASAQEQIQRGAQLYTQHCVLCHGADGRAGQGFPRPIWGPGHDLAKFNTAKGLYDYLQLLMPFDDPTKIDDAGKMALTAFMLQRNGNWKAEQVLTPANVTSVPVR